MTSALHPPFCADQACHQRVEVCENVQIARDTFRLRCLCPTLASRILPGQFVMLRLADCHDPLLARPLALYDTVTRDGGDDPAVGIDVVYLVVGKMTGRLSRLTAGAALDVWGPLGNGFSFTATEHLVMVAGGIGQTPFMALAREYLGLRRYGHPPRTVPSAARVTLCYGARDRAYLAGLEEFAALGVQVLTSTDNGTHGHRGLVTEVAAQVLDASPRAHVVCCGPEPMMAAVARLAAERNVTCQVSLETPMACGVGICFSCVAKVKQDDGTWDYRRTCVEGPVFDAARIAW